MKKLLDQVLDIVFPRPCIACGLGRNGVGPFLCDLCLAHLPVIAPPLCGTCGCPGEMDYDYPNPEFQCGLCRKQTYRFDRARSLGRYDTVLKALIHAFKYQGHPGALSEITPILERGLRGQEDFYAGFDVLPVPLHPSKLRQRGFDQSFLLGREVARILNLPLKESALSRVRDTESQARKNRKERMENVRDAFQVVRPEDVAGRKLLLVVDVFTTGATVDEVTRVLMKCKARLVYVYTLARA